jgi:hypothetical protein
MRGHMLERVSIFIKLGTLKEKIEQYAEKISEKLRRTGSFPIDTELNMNTFKEFLKFYYPKNKPHDRMAVWEFDLVQKNKLGFKELTEAVLAFQPLQAELLKELPMLTQPAVFSYALEVTMKEFKKKLPPSEGRKRLIERLREKYMNSNASPGLSAAV